MWVARGQCIESYGVGEAYRPVLEALGRLSRSEARPALKAVLERYAPSWLLQLPALLSAEEAAALQPRVFGVMRERMVRELAEALEVFTTTQSLVLVFEDLHWADASTLTLLSVVAHRQEPARLLILATYRSTEAAREGSPLALLTQELAGLARSQEVAVGLFDEAAVAAYIETRFPVSVLPTRLAQVLYQRTEGNPLFVVSILQDLITRGVIGQSEGTWAVQGDLDTLSQETPEGIRQLVSSQRVRLQPKARRVLEAASVAGMEFSAAEVAAALEVAVAAVEERCARLAAQQQFLRPAGVSEWPDHTLAARYAFLHALYQQHWYEQVSPSRLQAWHQRIGERKEAAYGERVEEIAAELAVHFEQGRDVPRTLRYLQQAGENALRRNAYTESIGHLRKGLTLLPLLPDSPQRAQQELGLQATLSMPLILTKGYASPEVGLTCSRALTLCQQAGEVPQLFPVLFGLFRFYIVRGDVPTARQLSEQLMLIAQQGPDELTLPAAHAALAGSLFHGGDMVTARTVAEQGVALYDRQRHGASVFVYGEDPGVICQTFAAWSLFPLGYPHQAQRYTLAAVTLAQQLSHPFILAGAFTAMMITHELSRDAQAGEHARVSAHTFVAEPEFPHISASYAIWQGWRLTIQGPTEESIAEIRRGLAQWRSLGAGLWLPLFLGLLAEALGSAGQEEEGLATIAEALATASDTGQHWYDAELYRLYGELSLRTGERERGRTGDEEKIAPSLIPPFAHSSPEECFLKAIEIARQQEAKMWELRAVMSLVRLRQRQATQSE